MATKYLSTNGISHLYDLIKKQAQGKIEQPTYRHVKCEYCDSWVDTTHINCPNCGAPIKRR